MTKSCANEYCTHRAVKVVTINDTEFHVCDEHKALHDRYVSYGQHPGRAIARRFYNFVGTYKA